MAGRIGLPDIAALPDPLLQYQAELFVPTIPGSGSGTGLKTRLKTFAIPGEEKEDVEVTLHGVTLKYAGRTTYTHTMSLTFIETRDIYVMTQLKAWLAYSRNILQTQGTYKSQYSTTAYISLYDDTETVVQTIKIFGSFMQSMTEVNLDGSVSSPVEVTAQLYYDYTQFFQGQVV